MEDDATYPRKWRGAFNHYGQATFLSEERDPLQFGSLQMGH